MEVTCKVTSLLVITVIFFGGAAVVNGQDTPTQVVEHFLSLPHGVYRLSPEDRVLLDKVKAAPAPYVEVFRKNYPTPEVPRGTPEDVLRFERAITFLGQLDDPGASDLLANWYARLDASTGQGPSGQSALNRRLILDTLSRKHPEVTTRVLDGLDRMDYASRVSALSYLRRTGKNDKQVIESLNRRVTDRNSPLYRDASVEQTLRAIRSQ